ncbi:MAG: DUF86 domain-containing protein [Deltaproteobacteria bacterium]|nr:DUF86 domain-containing protein [Deltaproteobacteria bacterium]
MVDRDLVIEKIGQIQRCLKRIQDKTKGDPESLNDIDIQDIFVLNLQRAVQTGIDLAAHIVADEGLGLPADLGENFLFLEKAKVIPATLAQRLRKMVGFRNIAVHEYAAIDPEVLKSILTKDLKDVEEFYSAVFRHFGIS